MHNRYRIDGLLGQGGMGAVYLAWDISLGIPVALKENPDASSEAQRQFSHEAHILASLSHPNLPRVTDYFFIPDQGQYLVMDFADGEDLQAMLSRLGMLPEPQVIVWISQVCDALAYLHSQPSPVIHRDIKPANIRIRPDGRAMLVDFGIAKVYDPLLATTIGAKAVTPGYSPPEQYGGGTTDGRSDIYALGATLYHLLTGHPPPESVQRAVGNAVVFPPRQINQRISPLTEQAILKAIEVATERRFQNVDELRAALTQPEPVLHPQVNNQFFPLLRLVLLGGIGLATVALIVSALVIFWTSNNTRSQSTSAVAVSPTTEVRTLTPATPSVTSSPSVTPLEKPISAVAVSPTTEVSTLTPVSPSVTPSPTVTPSGTSTLTPILIATLDLSQASFIKSCRKVNLIGSVLHAECQTFDGKWNPTFLQDARLCSTEVLNIDGYLICDSGDIPTIPRGTYQKTCANILIDSDGMNATCKTQSSIWRPTFLSQVSECSGSFENNDGNLRCKAP